ncbi:Protein of unknown function [Gryllus bimaculatus]|nr:Protein of unknown function [Gryllus bimaculatus]
MEMHQLGCSIVPYDSSRSHVTVEPAFDCRCERTLGGARNLQTEWIEGRTEGANSAMRNIRTHPHLRTERRL